MQRSRLKNIINKSKEISNKSKVVGDPFDEFKKSLPKELEIDDNYRLEAAWKAYGSPKDYKHALWEGLIQPIDETNFKLPSIGYNEDTDEYEYLNKGEDNETVAKDIRVWDNDVIPFVKELKYGGYIRKFNKEKDCWTYTKNSQKEDTLDQEQVNIQKEPSGIESINENNNVEAFKQGGQMNVIPEGALHARKNNMEGAGEDFTAKGIPVIDKEGEQQAEIERDEIIFRKQVTDKMEELYKKYNSEESSSKKDEIAIEMGKIITLEIVKHTDDRTGLIDKIQEQL